MSTVDNATPIEQEIASRTLCRRRLLPFVLRNVEDYEAGWIHQEICEKLEQFEADIIAKKSPRLMLFMPPRHGKSELASTQFPGWFMGRNPNKEIISCSYSASLAMSFSRKVREMLRDPRYQSVFPDTELAKDSQSTENWITTKGGGYLAAGVGGPITGRGAHCLIIDDPVKNRAEAESGTERDRVGDWYSSTARTRLAPGGGVLLILTRWHNDDLAGRLLEQMKKDGEQWEIVVYPAVATHDEKYRRIGDALHPARYDEESLKNIKKSLTTRDWAALFQQQPSSEEGAIIKRTHWNRWTSSSPPAIDYIIQSYDTAYSNRESADFSVISTWGLFYPDGDLRRAGHVIIEGEDGVYDGTEAHIMLLDVAKGRWSFPELKDKAYQLYSYWSPDSTIIEAKATGLPLAHELRRTGIPVQTFTPSRGNDKMTRVHSVTDLFASGYVWASEDEFADDLIEECHRFPNGKNDDQVDSTTQALIRFRKGGFIRLMTDDDVEYQPRRKRAYY